jgi:hypothetical protein
MQVSSFAYIRADHDAFTAAYLLGRYREMVGVPFSFTSGTSACNALRVAPFGPDAPQQPGRRPARKALLKWDGGQSPARGAAQESLLRWDRPADLITPAEREMPYVLAFDKVQAYLSAMSVTVLPWDALEHCGIPGAFDANIPGYWQVSGPWQPFENLPDLTGRGGEAGPRWLATPTVALLLETGMPEEMITDAWLPPVRNGARGKTLPQGARLLRGDRARPALTETLRDALPSISPDTPDPDEAHVREALKATYREMVGMLERGTRFVKRTDWADQIIAMTRATILRKAIQAGTESGRWPLRINSDCVYYATATDDPRAEIPAGWKTPADGAIPTLGQWDHKKTIPMAEFLATDVNGTSRKV